MPLTKTVDAVRHDLLAVDVEVRRRAESGHEALDFAVVATAAVGIVVLSLHLRGAQSTVSQERRALDLDEVAGSDARRAEILERRRRVVDDQGADIEALQAGVEVR